MKISLDAVRWRPPAGAHFERARAVDRHGKRWLEATEGQWRSEGVSSSLTFSEISLASGVLHSLPLELGEDSLRFPNAAFRLEESGLVRRLRIVRMSSPTLELRGSIQWQRGRVNKADLYVLIPSAWTGRLPENVSRRLSVSSEGKRVLKCAYARNQLTLYGGAGPLMRATWSPE